MVDPMTTAVGVWLWESFGKDIVAKVSGKASDKVKDRWEKFSQEKGWEKAAGAYQRLLWTPPGTLIALEMQPRPAGPG